MQNKVLDHSEEVSKKPCEKWESYNFWLCRLYWKEELKFIDDEIIRTGSEESPKWLLWNEKWQKWANDVDKIVSKFWKERNWESPIRSSPLL